MSDFETSPPREIEIDADGEGGEALLNKSLSPEPENIKANGRKSSSDRHKSRSRSRSRTRSGSHSRHRHRKSRKRHSRSRSRSRSPRKHQRSRNSRSRTKSRSRERRSRYEDDYRTPDYRDDSRSPMSSRKRHAGDRENPEPNRCLGVFGLSLYTQERGLRDVFGRYGPIEEVQIVYDRQSGRSRGFGFVYFRSSDDAFEAKEHCNGLEVDGRRIRVDYSITERAHTPTPGIYLGQASERRSSNRKYTSSFRRSPTPDYTYGYRRSRSYSPARLRTCEEETVARLLPTIDQ